MNKDIQQPVSPVIIRPIFLWRPDRVSGIPVLRDKLAFALEIPIARFHENEKPCFLAIFNAPPL